MSALAHLGANGNSLRHKPILSCHQKAIAATAESEPYTTSSVSLCFWASKIICTDSLTQSQTLKLLGECMTERHPADMPSTTSTSTSPATPTNASPVSDSSTRLSAIQTVQNYLTCQAQAIQLHLTVVLPGLVQGEVCTQCAQLAQEIGAQISLIQEELIRPTGDQDDPMLSSSEENKGGRGHGKQPLRHSCNKGKGKKGRSALESNNNAADSSQQLNNEEGSQWPNT